MPLGPRQLPESNTSISSFTPCHVMLMSTIGGGGSIDGLWFTSDSDWFPVSSGSSHIMAL